MLPKASLGRGGITTTALGFGTGGLLRIPRRRGRQEVLAAAFGCGIRHFDTAPIYGLGESERALGQFLRGRRAAVTVTTKFGLQVSRGAAHLAPLQGLARRVISLAPGLRKRIEGRGPVLYSSPRFDPESVRASLERSLRALSTDYVDLFLAHECSPHAPLPDDLLGFLEKQRQAGRIREYGIAASFESTRALLPQCSALAHVCQFDGGIANRHVAAIRDLGAVRTLITHGVMAGLDAAQPGELLRAALAANRGGVVLMQSRSVERIEANIRAAS